MIKVSSENCGLGVSPSGANTVRLSSNISTALGGLGLYSSGFNRQLILNRTVLQVEHLFQDLLDLHTSIIPRQNSERSILKKLGSRG